jgi:hypothetical protein
MRHNWFVAVLLALAALAGYAAGTRPVEAQAEAFPFQVGDTVRVSFQNGGTRPCWIQEIRGTFARCGNTADREGPTIGRRAPEQEWVNVAVVEWVTRPREQR